MTSYFARSASFQGIANLPKLSQTKGIKGREAGQPILGQALRGVQFRVARPESLSVTDAHAASVRSGLMQLRNALGATNIEVHLTMSPGDADFNKRDVLRFFKWFHAEKEAGRGELRRLAAKIIPEGLEKADLLNLIDAQMGDHSTLDLPTDNPEGSYNARIAFARRVLCNHRRAIKDQK